MSWLSELFSLIFACCFYVHIKRGKDTHFFRTEQIFYIKYCFFRRKGVFCYNNEDNDERQKL